MNPPTNQDICIFINEREVVVNFVIVRKEIMEQIYYCDLFILDPYSDIIINMIYEYMSTIGSIT